MGHYIFQPSDKEEKKTTDLGNNLFLIEYDSRQMIPSGKNKNHAKKRSKQKKAERCIEAKNFKNLMSSLITM